MRYLLYLCLPVLLACTESTGEVENPRDAKVPVPTVPDLPVYASFAELAPLFEADPAVPTLINFWATWCKPCVEELPDLERLRAAVPADELRIVLVSLDFPQQIDTKLKPFLAEHDLRSEVIVLTDADANAWIPRVHADWDGAIPVTLLRTGERTAFHRNKFDDYEAVRAFVGLD